MIQLHNISKHLGSHTLFSDLSLTAHAGERIGIIGRNGCGKSSLLKIVSGQDRDYDGTVDLHDGQVYQMPQVLEHVGNKTIDDYLNTMEYPDVWRHLSELDLIDQPISTPITQLSGGQKTKLLLIRAFTHPSSVLLLDEPTNHLDAQTRQWLTEQVRAYRGVLLVVSHDRAFLNACATRVLEIDQANEVIHVFPGGYDAFKEQKAAWFEAQSERYRLQEKKRKQMTEWITRKRVEASVYSDPAKGRQLRQMERRLEREVVANEIEKPRVEAAMVNRTFGGATHRGKLILRLTEVALGYEGTDLLDGVTADIRGPEHVRLMGSNGSGKSTLIRAIRSGQHVQSGEVRIGEGVRVGYFAQEQETLDPEKRVIDHFTSIPGAPYSLAEARRILGAFLFAGDQVFAFVRNLSHGERVRLQLALLLQRPFELLILDEPTNHLDIDSREVLETALASYQGALLVVSHDDYFLERVGVSVTWSLGEGKMRVQI